MLQPERFELFRTICEFGACSKSPISFFSVLQDELGCHGRFHADGNFRSLDSHELASGGQVCAFWGTEMGSRRDQAMIAWDYDVDLAVFIRFG